MSGVDENTLLLLHAEDFFDSVSKEEVTNNGVTISNDGKFNKCFYVDQAGIKLKNDITINSNNFSMDFWIKPTRFDGSYYYHLTSDTNTIGYSNNGIVLKFFNKDIEVIGEVLTLNEFSHIAVCSSNNVFKFFVNGILKKEYLIDSNIEQVISKDHYIFKHSSEAHNPVAYFDEFRISDIARWQNNFTPPKHPYGSIIIEVIDKDENNINFRVISNKSPLNKVEVFVNDSLSKVYNSNFSNLIYTIDTSLCSIYDNVIMIKATCEDLSDSILLLYTDIIINAEGNSSLADISNFFNIISKTIHSHRDNLFNNLISVGHPSEETDSLNKLIEQVRGLSGYGKKWASGSHYVPVLTESPLDIPINLDFKPSLVLLYFYNTKVEGSAGDYITLTNKVPVRIVNKNGVGQGNLNASVSSTNININGTYIYSPFLFWVGDIYWIAYE